MLTIKEITSIIMHHLPSIQIEDCGSVDLTAYRFRYALGFLLYHTTRKMSNAHSSANRQESITPTTHIKKESTPHGLLSFSFPKAIPHKERLATLHAICLQISRHISQKCS